jgi:hypothetical protein
VVFQGKNPTYPTEVAVAVQSAATGRALWDGVLRGTVIDTTHGYPGNIVTNGSDLFGCSAPWAVGAVPRNKPVCRAYSLATGQVVEQFTLPDVSSQVVLNPLAASPSWLLVSAEVGPWSCAGNTGASLNACRPAGSRVIAVPLHDPAHAIRLPVWGVLQDTFNFSPTDAVTVVSPDALIRW